MATGMMQWLAATGAALVIVGLFTLPPSWLDTERRSELPEAVEYRAVETEIRRDVGVLQAMLWSDSLSQLAVRTAVDGVATGVPADGRVTPEGLATWTERLTAFVNESSPRDPGLVFGYFSQPVQAGRPDGAPSSLAGRNQTFVGTWDGTSYCIDVDPDPNPVTDARLEARIGFLPLVGLGDCRLYVKYGLPGSRIERWLEDGGFRFAERDQIPASTPLPRDPVGSRDWLVQVGAPVFGLVRQPVVDERPSVGRCLAGEAAACERALTAPEEMREWNASPEAEVEQASPLTHASRVAMYPLISWQEQYMLADVERAFGTEAFSRFWTSEAPVSEAFREAFGTDLGSWVSEWAQERVGAHRAGPALRAGAPLWILLTLMVFGAAASLVGARRRVG